MFRRVVLYGSMGLISCLFLSLLLASSLWKERLGEGNISDLLAQIDDSIEQGAWMRAEEQRQRLQQSWHDKLVYLQYSSERREITDFEHQLIYLQNAIAEENTA
ncbi:MAG: DUF4363 family protein, partial [Limnochordia bacterium]